eukprot:symbB.v1.2.011415.t1/scaffold764.1/size165801/21
MAPTKHELVIAVLDKMMDNQTFTKQELDSALGRLQWATNCCPLTKPFLQAFWQWKSAVKSSGKPNKLLRGFAHLLHCLFEKDYHHPTPYAPQSSWWGASDASASDSGEAYVGGWISNHPNPEKHQVWWFHYQVREDQHPWAFKDRKPKRRIAALEMLGTLFLTMYLCKKSSLLKGPVLLPLASDNQGNIYGLLNDYTRKMPTAGLLMEIMFQLTATSCSLVPSHVKRDFNQWADDLTHPSFEGFDSSLELRVTPLLSEFKIFPWILRHLDAQGDLPGPETAIPDLQELALETVRDHGLEMTFEQKGLANFRFFGGKLPGDPSVRVQKPLLSTALEIGDPKCLDGQRADLVVCRPEAGGPLGLDYLETMWHAFEELLEPGGRLVPSSLVAKVVAVEWMPWLDASAESTRLLQPTLGLKHEQVLLDHLKLLSSEVSIPIDLTSRQEPAISSELKAHQSGLLTSFALWHEPDSYASMSGTKEGFVTVCFVDTPQMVDKGQRIPFYLCIQDCELVAVLPPPVDKRKG